MEISISKKNYETLLKHIAVGDFIYGVMSDMVSDKYKKDSQDSDELIHQLLKYCDDPNIKTTFKGKNVFTDIYGDKIGEDIIQYENFVVEDLTGVDIEEIDKKFHDENSK